MSSVNSIGWQPAQLDLQSVLPRNHYYAFGQGAVEALLRRGIAGLRFRVWKAARPWRRVPARVRAYVDELAGLTDSQLDERTQDIRHKSVHGLSNDQVCELLALVREVSHRELGLAHYDVQLIASWLLTKGVLAEVDTGEGKSLVACTAACLMAFQGRRVHVVTSNDYLASRDAEYFLPVFQRMGVSVASVVDGQEPPERKAAYSSAVVYLSNKEVAFDYLKDLAVLGRSTSRKASLLARATLGTDASSGIVQGGLDVAIVDEADSVLIDDAKTPLILSQSAEASHFEPEQYASAMTFAAQLNPQTHYSLSVSRKSVRLLEPGLAEVAAQARTLFPGTALGDAVHLVESALASIHLFTRDEQYIVRDDEVVLVDENTGRPMPDRSLQHGMHQLLEVKEGVSLTSDKHVLNKTTYQEFFCGYMHLCGMTGTVREVANEVWRTYHLPFIKVPRNLSYRGRFLGHGYHPSRPEKFAAIEKRIRRCLDEGRPVLVGTGSVLESEQLGQHLADKGISRKVLNAAQDAEESAIIEQAGMKGSVVVATGMAGRGTDIALEPAVRKAGGLHVIAANMADSRRVDRQLFGRTARQGDPGSYEYILSCDDPLLAREFQAGFTEWLGRLIVSGGPLARRIIRACFAYAQIRTQWQGRHIRSSLQKQQRKFRESFYFG